MEKIGAVIVLYNPDFVITRKALESLVCQVDQVCVVDNSPSDHTQELSRFSKVEYKPLKKNIGIAAAQNIGIRYFVDRNFEYVVFTDQDSIASSGLILHLREVYDSLESRGIKIATIGPMPINRHTSRPYITKANIRRKFSKQAFGIEYALYEMYSIISSFSFMKLNTFDKVGLFEEKLFIDGVDDEWGWRAYDLHQMSSFIISNLSFSHYQGVESDSKTKFKKSTPFRSYFQFRNFVILYKRPYTPLFWKRRNLVKFFVKFLYYPCFVTPRLEYLSAIMRGLKDGLTNKY